MLMAPNLLVAGFMDHSDFATDLANPTVGDNGKIVGRLSEAKLFLCANINIHQHSVNTHEENVQPLSTKNTYKGTVCNGKLCI